jgi:formiminoglutamate deiminase
LASRRIWCEHAALPAGVADGIVISIDEGIIADVEPASTPPPGCDRLDGLTLPGLANAHSHAFHRALRGRTHGGRGDFWSWRDQMYAVAARLTPDNYLALARATFAEMLTAGYTCVGEFHYVHHEPPGALYPDPNAMGQAIIDAAHQTGIRLTLLDACYLRAGAKRPVTEQQRRFSDGTANQWRQRVDRLRDRSSVRIGAAIHSVRAVDADSIAIVAKYAAQRDMPLHAHVSEQVAENEQVGVEFHCSPTVVLAQQGALSARFTAVHATHVDRDDIDLYTTSRSMCCFCPTTERDLADGIGPSAELSDAGVPLCIGSDQHAVIDPFEEMRAIELDERLRSMRRGTHAARALLDMGSVNGYRSLGWEAGGVLAVGALADLTTISLDSARLAGSRSHELIDAAVFAATASDVTDVMVGGRSVVRDGHHLSIDTGAELRQAIAAVSA